MQRWRCAGSPIRSAATRREELFWLILRADLHKVDKIGRVRRSLESGRSNSGGPYGAKTFVGIALSRTVLEILAVKVC